MLPTPGDLYVSTALTNVSVAYMQTNPMIADQVFPVVPITVQGGKYFKFRKGDWYRAEMKPRAPGTESAGSGWRVSTDDFFAEQYAFHTDINDTQRANAAGTFNLEKNATDFVTRTMLLSRELLWARRFFVPTPWNVQVTGVGSSPGSDEILQWHTDDATPQANINYYSLMMARLTGYRPNVLIIGPEVELALLQNPDLIDRVKYTQNAMITRQLIASYLGVERLLVADAVVNSGPESEDPADDDFDFVFGKSALLCYSAPAPGLEVPSAGYTFAWNGLFGSSAYGSRISKFRMEHLKSDRIEGEMAFDMKVVSSDLGIFFSDLVA